MGHRCLRVVSEVPAWSFMATPLINEERHMIYVCIGIVLMLGAGIFIAKCIDYCMNVSPEDRV
ncbi:MAG: hypothetical protein ACW99U_21400 [Candidatus Thorarchaeota archaeon]|jgi:hypothetical protein